jgi:transposase
VNRLLSNVRRRILEVLAKTPLTTKQVEERFGVSHAFAHKLVHEAKKREVERCG